MSEPTAAAIKDVLPSSEISMLFKCHKGVRIASTAPIMNRS